MALWFSKSVSQVGKSASVDAFYALLNCDYNMTTMDGVQRERIMQAHLAIDQFRWLVGHTWISTEGSRFGIAIPGCRPGDKLCVFRGGEPLYIIRPDENRKNTPTEDEVKLWEFVGIAYVPHLMDQQTTDDARKCPDQMYVLA